MIADQFIEVIEEVLAEKAQKEEEQKPVKKTTKPKRRVPAGVN